ncbi:MAG TPA: energy transducer TonB [Thermoanaerobaculia bacterium]
MFETVRPHESRAATRLGTLPISLALHGVLIVVVVAGTIWHVEFPERSPNHSQPVYTMALPPPPPPPPPPPAAGGAERQADSRPLIQEAPEEIVAPSFIPDAIPELPEEAGILQVASVLPDVGQAVSGGGVDGGVIGGIIGGTVGGVIGGVGIPGIVTESGSRPVQIVRDAILPLVPLARLYPLYPDEARRKRWEDWLVVRYHIGKDGRVKEVKIISRPEQRVFEEATIRAVRHWRFRPLVRDGVAQEVTHELTINFKLREDEGGVTVASAQ